MEKNYKSIKNWREDERPRERLITHGASSLSDAELLAILISSGTRRFSALDAARALLEKGSSLSKLASCDISELKQIPGIGKAKAVKLSAAFELGKRIQAEPYNNKKFLNSAEDIAYYYIPRMRGLKIEMFYALLLSASNQLIREELISKGTLDRSLVHPREVFRTAILESAAGIILLHNHPSGNLEPSKDDILITKQLINAGNFIDIKVIDHIIIAGDSFTSLIRRGLI